LVQRPRSTLPAANVRAAAATASERPPASTGRAGREEDLAAGSGEQDAAGPGGDGRVSGTIGGRQDAGEFIQIPGVPAAFGNGIVENELMKLVTWLRRPPEF